MKVLVQTVELLNRQTGELELASLYEGIDEKNILDFERAWQPAVANKFPDAASGVERVAAQAEDAHWDWKRLAKIASNPLLFSMYAIECADQTQGLSLVRKGGVFSRHPDHKGVDLIYMERIATAPWNRPGLNDKPLYKGIGQILVAAAANLSFDEGLGGRIGLHSLPGAETFYRDIVGMTDLGPDPTCHGLQYFELSSAQSTAFLA